MTKKQRTKRTVFSLLISKVFPIDDAIAIDILRLMSGCNDIYFLEEWVKGHMRMPTHRDALSLATGRNALQMRLLYSVLHESLVVIHQLKGRAGFEKLEPLLDDTGKEALRELLTIKLKEFDFENQDWGINEAILRARHKTTFHYDPDKLKEALQRWLLDHSEKEESYIVIQEKDRILGTWPYYAVADMVRAEVAFGIRNPNHSDNLNRAFDLMRCLAAFTDNLFRAYVEDRKLNDFIRQYADGKRTVHAAAETKP
jgi:hypothetical protein